MGAPYGLGICPTADNGINKLAVNRTTAELFEKRMLYSCLAAPPRVKTAFAGRWHCIPFSQAKS
jgi:hypothetical protein